MITAVVLAAGISSRLRPLTDHKPKSLLEVGGKTLLGRNLDALQQNGIRRCVLVTGYLHTMVEEFVRSGGWTMEIDFLHNPVFENTNNNYSLWITRPAVLGNDMLLLDADILYDSALLARLLESSHEDSLIMRRSDSLGHEEIKCELDGDGIIRRIGKQIDPAKAAGESVGIERFSAGTTARLYDVLSRRHVHNEFYEASFQEMIDGGVRIHAIESGELPCVEIDTPDDLAVAQELAHRIR